MPQINTRLRQKIDTEANWNKATNFIPLDGEIIIYKADINHPYERSKIGDGETTVINLAFVNSIDTNLTQAGQAADAKAVGDAISVINGTLNSFVDSEVTAEGTNAVSGAAVANYALPKTAIVANERTLTFHNGAVSSYNIYHDGNIIYSETEPSNPVEGTIWLIPPTNT